MGKTQTIVDKEKADAEFRAFMEKLDIESKAEEKKLSGEIDALKKKHYDENGFDNARLFGEARSDYQNYDDWGLERVNAIVASIANALKVGDYPSKDVPGSEEAKPSTIEKAKEFMGLFAGDYSLIIARVQALISAALSQFSVKSEAARKSELRDMPLSGGLHLFFASSGKVYKESRFFSNQFIGSFQIVFEAYMSVDEARLIGLQQILVSTEKEIAILNDMIQFLREEQSKSLKEIIKKDIADYKSTKLAYDLAIDDTKADRDKVMEQYNKYKSVTNIIDEHFDQLNLSAFRKSASTGSIELSHLFSEWEMGIAKRYIDERIAA
jgi:hypothetical protein